MIAEWFILFNYTIIYSITKYYYGKIYIRNKKWEYGGTIRRIGLKIINQRPDKYHNICSVFIQINLHDKLYFVPNKKFKIESKGIKAPLGEKNIVFKVAQTLNKEFGISIKHKIVIDKNIPIGAKKGTKMSNKKIINVSEKIKTTFLISLKIFFKKFFNIFFKSLFSSSSLLPINLSTLSLMTSLKGDEMIETTRTKVQLTRNKKIKENVKKII